MLRGKCEKTQCCFVLTYSIPLLLLLFVLDGNDSSSLVGKSLLSSVSHVPVSQSSSLHLVGEVLGSSLLGLGLVNVLHEDSLVLEDVTL